MKRNNYIKILTSILLILFFSSCLRLGGDDDETAPTITINSPMVWDKDTSSLPTVNTTAPATQACSLNFTNFDPSDSSNNLLNIIYSPTVSIPINITASDTNLKYLVVNIYKQEDLDGIDVKNMPDPVFQKIANNGVITETWTPTLSGTQGGYFIIISAIDNNNNEKCYFLVVGIISDISGLTP